MENTEIIWLLLFIGYAIGFIIIAFFGIMGTNEAIDFQNDRLRRYERQHQKWLRGKNE
jgi:hypothetical protein